MAQRDDLTARLLDPDDLELDDLEDEKWLLLISDLRTRWSNTRTLVVVVCLILLATLATGFFRGSSSTRPSWFTNGPHPIDKPIADANTTFASFLGEGNPTTVAQAASEYRKRRGRHPPPFFDKWFAWAQEKNCTHIESMFDQVHEDIEPFWGVHGAKVRADAASFPLILTVRDGVVERRRMLEPIWGSRDRYWEDMLKEIPSNSIPDIDMPMNTDDKAHIFVPWEEINGYIQKAAASRRIRPASEMSQRVFIVCPCCGSIPRCVRGLPVRRKALAAGSRYVPTRKSGSKPRPSMDLTTPATFPSKGGTYMTSGFVSNWTAAKSPCNVLDLRNLHGTFVNSVSGSHLHWKRPENPDRLVTRQFSPMFSSGKISGSDNDIVIPPATSWTKDYFSADNTTWAEKHDEVFWRGGASAGVNNATNWTRFHRHRFISLNNGTQVAMTAEAPNPPAHVPGNEPPLPYNIPLPDPAIIPLAATSPGTSPSDLGDWITLSTDVAFTNLACSEGNWYTDNDGAKKCSYDDFWYKPVDGIPMEQMFHHKYLPDVDGHGYSGRFRSFMDSDSVPIKATIWAEWTSSRLYAWKHFVPMDNTFVDYLGLLEYFLGV